MPDSVFKGCRRKIFFGPKNGISYNLLLDIVKNNNYEYCYFDKKLPRGFTKILKILPHCFQRILFAKWLKYDFLLEKSKDSRNNQWFFAFFSGYEMYGERDVFLIFLQYLKKEFKNCKLGIYMYDAMQTDDAREFVSSYRKYFDSILTFNRYDALEQQLEYYGPINEKDIVPPQGEAEESDVYYAGGAGWARYKLIVDTFKWLSDCGKKCIFFVPVSPVINKKYFSILCNALGCNIPYTKKHCFTYKNSKFYFNTYISYAYSLSYILKTQCMLEIIVMPEGRASCTNRLAQAMGYKRKLLTNSHIIKEEPYYRQNNISFFTIPKDIDLNFFEYGFVDIDHDFSALGMLKYMEAKLFGNIY